CILKLAEVIPRLKIGGFGQELDTYRDSHNVIPEETTPSETSSEGEWASGDEEVVFTHWKYDESTQTLEIFESTEGSQDEE
ncbi:hypothetical protein FRC01_009075, partial [Tulasnella sp. 417]